jgi:hypothetical protein
VSVYNVLNAGIYSKLSGGTALISALGGTAIYFGKAKDSQVLPYVVFSYQHGSPDNIVPSEMTTQLVYARAYAARSDQAGTIDGLISSLLHKQELTVSGWKNFWLARETEVAMPETDEAGVTTWTAGAFYRIRMSED